LLFLAIRYGMVSLFEVFFSYISSKSEGVSQFLNAYGPRAPVTIYSSGFFEKKRVSACASIIKHYTPKSFCSELPGTVDSYTTVKRDRLQTKKACARNTIRKKKKKTNSPKSFYHWCDNGGCLSKRFRLWTSKGHEVN
jgi:hypothetical protein